MGQSFPADREGWPSGDFSDKEIYLYIGLVWFLTADYEFYIGGMRENLKLSLLDDVWSSKEFHLFQHCFQTLSLSTSLLTML